MRVLLRAAVAVAFVLSLGAGQAVAQNNGHWVAVSTFDLPIGPEGQGTMMFIDSVMVPLWKVNPHIMSAQAGRHQWGGSGGEVAIILEYATWGDIQADCGAPCDEWTKANEPAEGTERRAAWDKMWAEFAKHYSGHVDNIYWVPASRSK